MPVIQSVTMFFAFASCIVSIMAAANKCPAWLPPILISLTVLLMVFPK